MEPITREEFFARRRKAVKPPKVKPPHPKPGPPYGGIWLILGATESASSAVHVDGGRKVRSLIAKESGVPARFLKRRSGILSKLSVSTAEYVDGRLPRSKQVVLGRTFRGQADPAAPRKRRAGAPAARPQAGEWSAPLSGVVSDPWVSFPFYRSLQRSAGGKPAKMGISVGPNGVVMFRRDGQDTLRAASVEEAVSRLTGFQCEARVKDSGPKGYPAWYLTWRHVLVGGRRVRFTEPDMQVDLFAEQAGGAS